MLYSRMWRITRSVFAPVVLSATCTLSVFAQTTVTFQEGLNGYTGMLDVFISANIDSHAGGNDNIVGGSVDGSWIDGHAEEILGVPMDVTDPFTPVPDPQQKDLLMRFGNVFGDGPGQVPLGSKITNASLTLTTNDWNFADTDSPFGIARLLVPFTAASTWNLLGNGVTYTDGEIDRPVDNGFTGPVPTGTAGIIQNETATAEFTRIVQQWSDGAPQNGIVVKAGTNGGWGVWTTGNDTPENRPLLSITYEAPSLDPITTVAFQQGVNGYTGSSGVVINEAGGTAGLPGTTDVSGIDGAWLFYRPSTGDDAQLLIKFDELFESQGGAIPNDATITDAQLVLTVNNGTIQSTVPTDSTFLAAQVLVDWNNSTPYSGGVFGSNGPDGSSGELGPVLDTTKGLIQESQTWLDVTDAVSNWQAGEPNFGINLRISDDERTLAGQSDAGWFHLIGDPDENLRPSLIVSYVTEAIAAGDYDADGDVDNDDYQSWANAYGSTVTPLGSGADGNGDGVVDAADYTVWRDNYVAPAPAGASVPEPAAAVLCVAAALSGAVTGRKVRGRG